MRAFTCALLRAHSFPSADFHMHALHMCSLPFALIPCSYTIRSDRENHKLFNCLSGCATGLSACSSPFVRPIACLVAPLTRLLALCQLFIRLLVWSCHLPVCLLSASCSSDCLFGQTAHLSAWSSLVIRPISCLAGPRTCLLALRQFLVRFLVWSRRLPVCLLFASH